MTEEQISQWARESNMSTPLYDYQKEQLQAFATIVRNATLEEAALKCNQLDFSYSMCEQYRDGNVACECAEEIRKLKS
jgi:hypothetical protein